MTMKTFHFRIIKCNFLGNTSGSTLLSATRHVRYSACGFIKSLLI